ncbi:MAG: trimethylamine methyltransferase family protein [Clostridiales Family XIII bacterium]|jgi:trimethylamine:corrinoid methyltransferase-like protein|nr:trimethylamine methyltransferase family protein [Clostridiales Family XIII bacterium]
MAKNLKAKLLSASEIDLMKDQISRLLAKKGIRIHHPEVEKYLKEAGCVFEDDAVKFPEAVQEKYLAMAPREFVLAAPDPKYDIPFPHPEGNCYGRVNTGACRYLDVDGNFSNISLGQAEEIIRLTNDLEHIDFWSILSTDPVGFPAETIDVHTYEVTLANTKKHGWLQPYEAYNAGYMIRMAQAVMGGPDKLRERPIVSLICCSVPTLTYKFMDLQIILDGALNGVPLQPCSLPVAGANAPVTPSGLAVITSAEVYAQILIAQMIAPGTPCVATPLPFDMDMRTTYTIQSSISNSMARMMSMQLFSEGYGLPAHTYGTGSDSVMLDGQNFAERMQVTLLVALGGADVLGGAGQFETAKAISPLLLIIDNDIFGMAKKLRAGYEVTDATVGMDTILSLGEKDSFITSDHTMDYFREAYASDLFIHTSAQDRENADTPDILYKARKVYDKLIAKEPPALVDDAVKAEVAKIVAEADAALAKK